MKAHTGLITLATGLSLALAGCSSEAPDTAETDTGTATPTSAPEAAPPMAEDTGTGIPDALQGRWGLVPADCEPGRDDAKGLMVVDADSLEFYESMGTLGTVEQRSADMIHADFGFTGEGMSWDREMELSLAGDTLTRTEYGEEAMPGPLEYTRCG